VEGENVACTARNIALRLLQLEQSVVAEYVVQDTLSHAAVRSSHGDNMILKSSADLALVGKPPESLVAVQNTQYIVAIG